MTEVNDHYNSYKFELKPLPYGYSALEPYIDEETMHIHHDVHLAGYVNGLNTALDGFPKLQKLPAELIQPAAERMSLNSAIAADLIKDSGGVYCHNLYFDMMHPAGRNVFFTAEPDTYSTRLIKTQFGSINSFFYNLKQAALGIYGSGWAWLLAEPMKRGMKLHIATTPNHSIPDVRKYFPLTCLDMWEHAYYLQYKSNKSAYIDAWCRLVNWERMDERLSADSLM